MAKEKQSKYDQYAGKAPDETMQYRDVFEDQQLNRSRIEPKAGKTWRTVVAIVGAFFVAVLAYIVLSVGSGIMNIVSDFTSDLDMPDVTGSGVYTSGSGVDLDASQGSVSGDVSGELQGGEPGSVDGSLDIEIDYGSEMERQNWLMRNGYNQVGRIYMDLSGNEYTREEMNEMYGDEVPYFRDVVDETVDSNFDVDVSEGESGSAGVSGDLSGESGSLDGDIDVGSVDGTVSGESGALDVGVNANDPWRGCWYPTMWKCAVSLLIGLLCGLMFYQVMMRNWETQNLMNDDTDINQYHNDQHIAFPEEIQKKFDWFPDIGAHSGVQVSSLISHMMLSNKGLNSIKVADRYENDVLDENGDVEFFKGELKEDDNGDHTYHSASMIDDDLGKALFDSANIPPKYRIFFDTRKIKYNPGNKNRNKLKGYDTVADLINKEWEFPEYEPQRPAGAYIVDTEPVNTMVLAITRVFQHCLYSDM